MDSASTESRPADLAAVIDMTVQKADDIIGEYQRIDVWVGQVEANIQAARERQEALKLLYDRCEGTAALFGFNLDAERERAALSGLPDKTWPDPEIPDKRPSIREIILDLGREANGHPLRAAFLKVEVEARIGKEVHEKTVGMTLYRLSKDGAFVRRGYDWYFVPEADRLRQSEGNLLLSELLRQTDAANAKPPE